MDKLQEMVQNSTLTRLFANIFLLVLVLGASFLAGYEIFTGMPVSQWLIAVLATALGSSIKILGISTGATIATSESHPDAK